MVLNLVWLFAASFPSTVFYTVPIIIAMYICTLVVYYKLDIDYRNPFLEECTNPNGPCKGPFNNPKRGFNNPKRGFNNPKRRFNNPKRGFNNPLKLGSSGANSKVLLNRKLFNVGISLYMGWLSVAVLANVLAFLESLGYFKLNTLNLIAILFLVISVETYILFVPYLNYLKDAHNIDYIFKLVFIWAWIGIVVKLFNSN